MKKRTKKLVLSRETITDLGHVRGAALLSSFSDCEACGGGGGGGGTGAICDATEVTCVPRNWTFDPCGTCDCPFTTC